MFRVWPLPQVRGWGGLWDLRAPPARADGEDTGDKCFFDRDFAAVFVSRQL